MSWKRKVGWTALVTLFGLMLVTGVVFILASLVPEAYQPLLLSPEERQVIVTHFREKEFADFLNHFNAPEPFTHTIRQADLNKYLAVLDDLAREYTITKRGEQLRAGMVHEALDKAGLADPVVQMRDGLLTFMVRTKGTNKVLSFDLTLNITDDDRLAVRLVGVRIGRMPIPQFLVAGGLRRMKNSLARNADEPGRLTLDNLLRTILGAINEAPIPTDLTINKRTRRTHRIEIKDGQMDIHIVPVAPAP